MGIPPIAPGKRNKITETPALFDSVLPHGRWPVGGSRRLQFVQVHTFALKNGCTAIPRFAS